MTLTNHLVRVLQDTSRTFYIPISRLPARLQESVASAYLCMRAIDEIEDHPGLDIAAKVNLLRGLGSIVQTQIGLAGGAADIPQLDDLFAAHQSLLPEVTLRIGDWLRHAPAQIAPRIWDATVTMAERMAIWAENQWRIRTEADLDGYTFSVAGAVGLLLCDIWGWFDGSQIDRVCAVQFGRGLQAVNIIRNRNEDLQRGVDFYPQGWSGPQMFTYAKKYLALAKAGVTSMPKSSFKYFVEIPLRLAEATLEALENGIEKLSREQVLLIVGEG